MNTADKKRLTGWLGQLQRARRAKKVLKRNDASLKAKIAALLKSNGITKADTPNGKATLYPSTTWNVDPRELHKVLGDAAFDLMAVKIGDLREATGATIIEDIGTSSVKQNNLLVTPPTRKETEVTVKVTI